MAERTVFLHIGHHRTATSYLQARVFPLLAQSAYFHKRKTPASASIVDAFRGSPEIWCGRGEEIFAALAEEACDRSALVSSEEMSAHRLFASPAKVPDDVRRDPHLLAMHLAEARAAAERVGYDLKVIMGVRRQDQYFGSRYAKQGYLIETPSQADFARQVNEIIDPERRYFADGIWLDYELSRRLISGVLGDGGLLILPFERLGAEPDGYFDALSAFVGEPVAPDTRERENARSTGADRWTIDGRRPWRLLPRERSIEIALDKDLKARILTAYETSNRRLSTALGTDLGRYGYY